MKSCPCGGPSESLGFEFSESIIKVPETEVSGSLGEIQKWSAVLGDVSDTLSWIDLPLAESTEFCFNDHKDK